MCVVCVCVCVCVCVLCVCVVKAHELTELGKGKHHIGDFLPPEELEKFVETISAVKEDREPGEIHTHRSMCVCIYVFVCVCVCVCVRVCACQTSVTTRSTS